MGEARSRMFFLGFLGDFGKVFSCLFMLFLCFFPWFSWVFLWEGEQLQKSWPKKVEFPGFQC